jgi:hypothetical protein
MRAVNTSFRATSEHYTLPSHFTVEPQTFRLVAGMLPLL